jgi:hypothetical protein
MAVAGGEDEQIQTRYRLHLHGVEDFVCLHDRRQRKGDVVMLQAQAGLPCGCEHQSRALGAGDHDDASGAVK